MRRAVSAFLPTWPTDRVRRQTIGVSLPAEQPLMLAVRGGGPARGHAARPVPDLAIREAAVEADVPARNRFLQLCAQGAVADPPDDVVIEVMDACFRTTLDHGHNQM